MNLEKLLKNVPEIVVDVVWNEDKTDLVDVYGKPHAFIRDDMLFVSGEHGDGACDYYGEYRGGCAWINPILEKFAADNKCYWEWENAGCIVLNQY